MSHCMVCECILGWFSRHGPMPCCRHALDLEHDKDETLGDAYRKLDGQYSSSKKPIHVLIAICSSCCQEISRIRRNAVRDTWIQDARSKEFENVIDVKFFLSQPESKAKLKQVSSFIKVTIHI
jgi:hypothetical protein